MRASCDGRRSRARPPGRVDLFCWPWTGESVAPNRRPWNNCLDLSPLRPHGGDRVHPRLLAVTRPRRLNTPIKPVISRSLLKKGTDRSVHARRVVLRSSIRVLGQSSLSPFSTSSWTSSAPAIAVLRLTSPSTPYESRPRSTVRTGSAKRTHRPRTPLDHPQSNDLKESICPANQARSIAHQVRQCLRRADGPGNASTAN